VRGPPDPLKGDALYKSIRDTAQELINATYDTEKRATVSAVPATYGGMGSMSSAGSVPSASFQSVGGSGVRSIASDAIESPGAKKERMSVFSCSFQL